MMSGKFDEILISKLEDEISELFQSTEQMYKETEILKDKRQG